MDWIALAAVLSSGLVAVASLIINALTKRGDREHASTLEFEKRVWESKSDALVRLIGACEIIRLASRRTVGQDVEIRQYTVVEAVIEVWPNLDMSSLLAYAVDIVTSKAKMLEGIHAGFRRMPELLIQRERLSDIQEKKEAAIAQKQFEVAADWRQKEVGVAREIGRLSAIDVEAVDRLCAEIVDLARKDLRGKS
ncbi:hypothetical protein ACEWX3_07715 [Mycobacterium sp. G7A2]|uniref:hypothetical protein n=1 Tax=Mycobacterium sp. G7A2 TaxID=3317307 RepID=UPI0035A99F4D